MLFTKNPAMWIALIGSGLSLAVGFGLKVSGAQITLIMGFMGVAVPLAIGLATRSQVYPQESVQTALDMKAGTTLTQLDKKLEQQGLPPAG